MAKHVSDAMVSDWLKLFAAVAATGLIVAGGPGAANAQSGNITKQVQQRTAISLPSLSPLVERVMPAIVNISAQLNPQAAAAVEDQDDDSDAGPEGLPFNELLRRFFQNQEGDSGQGAPTQIVTALGSGFIIDPNGYIATNNHVVAHASKVMVIFQDNSRHPAKVVGRDPLTDLALLKIETPHPLPYVEWGNSDDAKVGDWVVAVGNPFGLGGTVTAGIISALGRDIGSTDYENFLQIDAPINRGNSGGPTFDLSGQVIGINTAIFSPSGGSVGLGFAIPSSVAKAVFEQLKATGHVEHGWLGVGIQNISPEIAQAFSLPNETTGALVASVTANSPAAQAGLKQGDVITAINHQPIKDAHDLRRVVGDSQIGQKLELMVERSGKEQTLVATVGRLPANPEIASSQGPDVNGSEAAPAALGLKFGELTPALRKRLHVDKNVDGVVITAIANDSPAQALGLAPGDIIVSVDQKQVTSPQDASAKLQAALGKGQILLLVDHEGTPEFLALSTGAPSGGAGNSG